MSTYHPASFDRLRLPSAIPRYQQILFWALVGGTVLLTTIFLHGCQQAYDRLSVPADNTPLAAPTSASEAGIPVLLADDADGSVYEATRRYALPEEPTTRARALLEHLLNDYSLPESKHPLPTGAATDDVFLLALPITNPPEASTSAGMLARPGGEVAMVNLRASFAQSHPSGVEVEDLTIRSIIGTLHANFPELTEVRFLVDGQPRETLAGHADLLRTYAVDDAGVHPSHPSNDLVEERDQPAPQPTSQP